MKRISKNLATSGKALALALLVCGVAIVQPAAAADCTTINNLASTDTSAIGGAVGTMNNDFSARLTAIGTDLSTLDKKISDARTAATTDFETKVSALENTTNLTSDQKTAIEQYKSDMETAEKTRETAVDTARDTYKTGLTNAITSYQQKLSAAAGTYQSTADGYFNWAKTQCADNKDQPTILSWLKDKYIVPTHATLTAAIGTSDVDNTISGLKTTRDSAISAANQTFATAAKGYAATLSTALNAVQDTSTSDSSSGSSNTSTDTNSTDTSATDNSTSTNQ